MESTDRILGHIVLVRHGESKAQVASSKEDRRKNHRYLDCTMTVRRFLSLSHSRVR